MSKPIVSKRLKTLRAAVESLESRVLLTRLTGIDVSYYQGTAQGPNVHINWPSVKSSGKTFAFIRATYGNDSDDADIDYNAVNALAAGMYVGFYHFAYYGVAGHPAITEANNYFDKVKPYLAADGKHLMPVLDVENGSTVADGGTLSDWVNAWCNQVKSRALNELSLNVTPMVYISSSPAGTYFDGTIPQSRPLWVANYTGAVDVQTGQPPAGNGDWQNGTSPSYYQTWAFWQYSSTGSVSGISGNVDLDVLQGDMSVLQNYVIGGAGRFADGTRVKTPYSINIWDTGNANGTVLGATTAGALGTIIEGPVYGNSFQRWRVDFDTGIDGWVAEYQSRDNSTLVPIEWLSGPVVTGVSSTAANASYKAGSVIPITVAFNGTATVTGTPRITLDVGGTAVNVNYSSGSGTSTLTFNYTVAAGHNDTDLDYGSYDSLTFNNGTIKDSLGNFYTLTLPAPAAAGSLGANKNIVIDTIAPTITGITSMLADGKYTVGAVVPIRITFNENVNVTGTPTLALNSGGSASYASGSGTNTLTLNYTIGAGQNAADLDYSSISALALSGGTIQDSATNNAALALPAPGAAGSLGANKNIVVDTLAPTVTNVTSSTVNGAYKAGAVIPITVQFSEVVNVTGTPQLLLNSGATVSYSSGSGTSTLTFNYTVGAGQNAADLDYASTSALSLNGGTIRDAATNTATLTLAAPGGAGSLGLNKNIVIDTAAPTIANVTSAALDGLYGSGSVIAITVSFSEVVNVTGTPLLALNTGGSAGYASGTGTTTLTFNYTVASGQSSADLDYSSVSALTLNGGTIQDPAANPAALTLPAPGAAGSLGENKNIAVDGIPPGASLGGELPNRGDATFDFTVSYTDLPAGVDFTTLDSSDVTVTGPGGFVANATFISVDVASNGSPRVATYRVTAPGGTWNVADNGTYTVSQNPGEVKDAANNARSAGSIGTFAVGLPFAYVTGSTLHIEYAPGASSVTLSSDGSNFVATEGATSLPFTPGTFSDIVVHGTAGDDAVVIATTVIEPLTLDGQTGNDSITIGSGANHTFAADAAAMSASLSITVNSGGSATFSANQHLADLTVAGTASMTGGPGKVVIAKSVGVTGSLDLNDNNLVVNYTGTSALGSWDGTAYTGVSGLVASGQINTSQADPLHSLGVGEASDALGPSGGTFYGESVDASAVLVKFTYGGDANLDGKLNIDDYTRIDQGIAGGWTDWINGDFNYDGKINIDDYVILDGNIQVQGPPI